MMQLGQVIGLLFTGAAIGVTFGWIAAYSLGLQKGLASARAELSLWDHQ